MKNKFARIMTVAFSLSLMVLMLSCGPKSKSNVESHELVLKIGELYKIPGIADDADVFNGLFESEDTSIAEVQGGRYIKAFKEGETKVYGTIDGVDIEYEVSVQDDEDRLRRNGVKSIQDKNIYLGGGYNMFKAEGMEIYKEINTSAIFLPDTISNYANSEEAQVKATILDGDGNATTQTESYTTVFTNNDITVFDHKAITGSDSKTYADNYATAISGSLGITVPNVNVEGKVTGAYASANVSEGGKQSAMGTYFAVVGKSIYSLTVDKATLRKLAQQNEYAWKDLTGSMPPAEVFARYGTHYVTEVILGGRVDIDYILTAKNSTTNRGELLSIAGEIGVQVSALEINASGSYTNVQVNSSSSDNYSMSLKIRAQGGNSAKAQQINFKEFTSTFKDWSDTLSLGDGTKQNPGNVTVIGFTDDGLKPIWWLLKDASDDPDEGARAEELRKAYLEMGGPELNMGWEKCAFESSVTKEEKKEETK